MVQVNNSSKKHRVSLLPTDVPPYSWFEYKGMLYLAIKWQDKNFKWVLDAVCFDPDFYTMQAEFCGDSEIKVVPIADKHISICYGKDVV
jgi:hypothetical protein